MRGPSPKLHPRPVGYYWVKNGQFPDDPYEVAYWDGRGWYTAGISHWFEDEDFVYISARKIREFKPHS
jgi:hypothetical protein